ncbi:MAG: ABC transporter ATP-binding protein [Dongiaceae bacterium]
MARIKLQGIEKRFTGFTAIDHLDMEIENGELLVLLGPSGCGKSTTLNIIAGLAEPTAGRVLFGEEDVTRLSPHQRNIAMVFQSSLLYPHLTARQNIFMSLKRSEPSRAEIERRIREVAAIVDIERLLDKLPSQLSGGERQRVATAKAIIRQPTAFLLDEPLGALDAAMRLTLRSELVNLQKRLKTTMVFVTHDQTEAMTMGDRIAVMRSGKVEQIGTPDEIYNRPATLFVAGFVGAPPMNFFQGRLEAAGGAPVFVAGPMRVPLPGQSGRPGQDVTLAIRPQFLRIRPEAGPDTLPASVFALEHLGNESVVIFETERNGKLRAVVPPGFAARIGEPLHVGFDPAAGKLFDRETERPLAAA